MNFIIDLLMALLYTFGFTIIVHILIGCWQEWPYEEVEDKPFAPDYIEKEIKPYE